MTTKRMLKTNAVRLATAEVICRSVAVSSVRSVFREGDDVCAVITIRIQEHWSWTYIGAVLFDSTNELYLPPPLAYSSSTMTVVP